MRSVDLRLCLALLVIATFGGPKERLHSQTKSGQAAGAVDIGKRTPWKVSRFVGSPDPQPQYQVQRAFPALTFNSPVAITKFPGSERLVVVELKGRIVSFVAEERTSSFDEMIDLSAEVDRHWRSYGIAVHPEFAKNRFVYLCYVLERGDPEGTRVSRFRVSETDPPVIDPASEQILLTWPSGGHNGGCIKFGPDGYLYITTGDGQNPHPPDPERLGQDLSDVRAALLRIDVDAISEALPYGIPPDNPFLGTPDARPEIWAYGLRNPWKMSFDPATGDLWVGDVGWELWEMVYRIESGGNYGWSIKEGPKTVNGESTPGPTPIIPPVVALPHTVSRSITGGKIYEGSRLRELAGQYIYGDYVTGKLWSLALRDSELAANEEIADSPLAVIAFGDDSEGELLIVDYEGGLYRLAPRRNAKPNEDFPKQLSRSGLFSDIANHVPARGVIPYSINAEPWADGARSQRMMGVPGARKLDVYEKSNLQAGIVEDEWDFPSGTVLAKTLSLPLAEDFPDWKRVETQILHRDGDTWRAYTYRWNDDQSDAILVDAAGADHSYQVFDEANDTRRKQTWHFASRTECLVCHTTRAGSIHGFNRRQLNKPQDYGDQVVNQLIALEQMQFFEHPVGEDIAQPDPQDESHDLESRARSYLHVNCAHCHRKGGGGNAPFELRYKLSLEETGIVGMRPTQGTFGIHRPAVVAAGEPYRSVLLYRMSKLGPGRMPYAGSSRVDEKGIELIRDWIAGLEPPTDAPSTTRGEQATLAALARLKSSDHPAPLTADNLQTILASTSGALRCPTEGQSARASPSGFDRCWCKSLGRPRARSV